MDAARPRRKWLQRVAYVLYLVAFVLGVDYLFFWRPFVADLRLRQRQDPATPPHVNAHTLAQLGALRPERRSSFVHFAPERGTDVIRLCAFGDSFTYGDEVADAHDFPTFLQERFDEAGVRNVEVLNFGNSWYGFHQAYILWDTVGRRFGCDFVLLGPDCFQPDRDTTFNHAKLVQPYYLHGRYVLEQDGVRLVEVIGSTAQERFDSYYDFFPRWQYARYDRNTPALLQALLPVGRTLPNPLYYYTGSAEEEAYATYDRLLRQLAGAGAQVFLFHSVQDIVNLTMDVDMPSLVGVYLARTERFPYNAPGGHYSAFGNRLLAEQYYTMLVDGGAPTTILQFEDREPVAAAVPEATAGAVPEATRPALSTYDRIEVRLAGQPTGFLAVASADPALRVGTSGDLHDTGVVSLVGFKNPKTSVVDAAWAPVPWALNADEPVRLRFERGSAVEEREVGPLRLIDDRASIGVVTLPGLEFAGDLYLKDDGLGDPVRLSEANQVTVLIGSRAVLKGTREQGTLRLVPLEGSLRNLRVDAGQYVSVPTLPAGGVLTMALERHGADVLEVPLARWSKKAGGPPYALRYLPKQIKLTGPRAVVVARDTTQDVSGIHAERK